MIRKVRQEKFRTIWGYQDFKMGSRRGKVLFSTIEGEYMGYPPDFRSIPALSASFSKRVIDTYNNGEPFYILSLDVDYHGLIVYSRKSIKERVEAKKKRR